MEIRNWLILCCLLVLIPGWIGSIWTMQTEITGKIKYLLFSWLTGFLTVMAVSQLILVPLVLRRYGFEIYQRTAIGSYLVLILLSLFCHVRKHRQGEKDILVTKEHTAWNPWQILFLVGALGLILIQAVTTSAFEHIDDDDSRFVVEQVIAVEYNDMYKQNPATGVLTYWDMGEVRKDMVSPWAMLVAFWCKLSGIAPAILCHKYLPFFLILLCYGVYALIAMHLFREDREKISIFLIFASALNIFGYFSTHTTQAVMLLRIWQGKALVGAMLLPAMFYIQMEIMSQNKKRVWYLLAALCSMAASLASGSGITVMPVLIGAFGLAELIHTRKIKNAVLTWCTAIPSVVYLLCYLFFWNIVKIYY